MNMPILEMGLILASACAVLAGPVKTETVDYTAGGVTMRGYLAYPDGLAQRRAGIVVFPEWTGLNAYAKHRAEELAALGYVALAADPYGDGKTARDTKEAASLSGALKEGDRTILRARAAAALAALRGWRFTDTNRVAAIGYCFGGTTALELARAGADLRAVVSFHGGLDTPRPRDARNIRAAVLVCHGADDPFNPKPVVDAFQDEMRQGGVDWQMVLYGGAVHSFTNPEAGNDKSKGVMYDPKADHRSWELMRAFLLERLGALE